MILVLKKGRIGIVLSPLESRKIKTKIM